jgi:hypothetical protein
VVERVSYWNSIHGYFSKLAEKGIKRTYSGLMNRRLDTGTRPRIGR